MKKLINEREMSQKMLKTLRSKRVLSEEFEPNQGQQPEGGEVPMEGEGSEQENKIEASEADVSEAQEKFRQNVAPDTQFSEYSILPDMGNVIFGGEIPGVGKWRFEFTQKEGFAFETAQEITMTNMNLEILKKMQGYFINWREEMSEKLLEYKGNQ